MIVLFVILPASCVHISLSGSKGPEVTEIGTTGGDGCDVRITCVHGVLMLCSGALVKGAPSFPVVPLRPRCHRLAGQKMLCKFSLRARMTTYGAHAYDCL